MTATSMNSSVQSLLSHSPVVRSNSGNLSLPNGQDNLPNHPFVGKSASSPIPEQTVSHTRSSMVPLSAVLSAPAPSIQSCYWDFQSNSSSYSTQQMQPAMNNSGDENQETHGQGNYSDKSFDIFSSEMNTNETSKRLGHFSSLRTRTARMHEQNGNNNLEGVSPYLCVDGNSNSVRNTFTQANSGMRGKSTPASHQSISSSCSLSLHLCRCPEMVEESSFTQICLLLLSNDLRSDDEFNHRATEGGQNHRRRLYKNPSEHQEIERASGIATKMSHRHRTRANRHEARAPTVT